VRIQIADRTYLPLSERPDPASPTTKAVPFMAFVEDEFFYRGLRPNTPPTITRDSKGISVYYIVRT